MNFIFKVERAKTMADITIKDLERGLAVHERECAERWKTIFRRLERQEQQIDRVENILIAACGAIILGGGSVIVTILFMHN